MPIELTIFATMSGLTSMIQKSLYAYAISFLVGGGLYAILAPTIERHFLRTPELAQKPIWILLQWVTTAYLWGVWLIQDMANIFVFLPRHVSVAGGETHVSFPLMTVVLGTLLLAAIQAYIFATLALVFIGSAVSGEHNADHPPRHSHGQGPNA